MVGAGDAQPSNEINPSSASPSDMQSPSSLPRSLSYGMDDQSLHSSHMNSRDSLLSSRHTSSLFGLRNAYFQVDNLGVYLSTVAISVLLGIVAVVGIILLTVVVTLSLELGKYKKHPQSSSCASFNLNAELNNLQGYLVPPECAPFVARYVNSGQYYVDFAVAVEAARQYLRTLQPVHQDGRDLVVLDIDETSLSNMPYYDAHHYNGPRPSMGVVGGIRNLPQPTASVGSIFPHNPHFGVEAWNVWAWNIWVNSAVAPALDPMLSLYTELRAQNWSIAFITGRSESMGQKTALNLHNAGYKSWTTLILRCVYFFPPISLWCVSNCNTFLCNYCGPRNPEEEKLTAFEYKSKYRKKLANEGYRIRSSLGDQWSDLMGENIGGRTFKMPNPMYYIH